MNRSESIGEIAKALAACQGQMKAAVKDSSNPFFKSKYADLATVIEAAREPMSKNGLAISQIPDTLDDGTIVLESILMHESGQWISGKYRMKAMDEKPQTLGALVTYARRYAFQAMIGLPAEDDDANAASGNDKEPKKWTPPSNPTAPKCMTIEQATRALEAIEKADSNSALLKIGDSLKKYDQLPENVSFALHEKIQEIENK